VELQAYPARRTAHQGIRRALWVKAFLATAEFPDP